MRGNHQAAFFSHVEIVGVCEELQSLLELRDELDQVLQKKK
jgi:hypothetical protein